MSDVTDLGEHLETFISALVSDGRYKKPHKRPASERTPSRGAGA